MLEFINAILHIDATLIQWAQQWGPLLYAILFLIIFCETGLVIMPFLPGDSLLFAAGALAARPEFLKIETLIPLLIAGSILGDSVNYFIGRNFGRGLFEKNLFFLKREYLTNTEIFFEKRGVWAVSISRFFPIIRTMAPFFAGMSLISYKKFLSLSVLGSFAWVLIFCLAGYFFGQIEIIKNNFTLLVMALFLIPGIPFAIGVLKALRAKYLLKKNTQTP
ncbi:VTT domain-containing protein [bacterium]|nr:VTT domain-containing protein [bacterium]